MVRNTHGQESDDSGEAPGIRFPIRTSRAPAGWVACRVPSGFEPVKVESSAGVAPVSVFPARESQLPSRKSA